MVFILVLKNIKRIYIKKLIHYYLIYIDYNIKDISSYTFPNGEQYSNFNKDIKDKIIDIINNKDRFNTTLSPILSSLSESTITINNYATILADIIDLYKNINTNKSSIYKLKEYGTSNIIEFNSILNDYKSKTNINGIINITKTAERDYSRVQRRKVIKMKNNVVGNGNLIEKFVIVRTLEDLCRDTDAIKSNASNEYDYIIQYLDNAETELYNFLTGVSGSSITNINTYIANALRSKNNLDCYKNEANRLYQELLKYRDLISLCSLRTITQTDKSQLDKHASVYNFLVPYINNYANTIDEIMNNMRMNVFTLGNKSFTMDSNIYLYNLYLKKKKDIDEFKLKFADFVNKTELVRGNSRDLYNFIIFLIIIYIIIIIGIYIYLYLYPSLLFVIIFVIIMMIIVVIFFTFKLGVSTRMLADKYYWSILTLKKID